MKLNLQSDQRGVVDVWFLSFIGMTILFLGALGFGFWANSERAKYKNNVEPLITDAVNKAEDALSTKKDTEFAEKEKNPLVTYTGPSAYGSVAVQYPKTWSAYADESARGSNPLDASFNPGFVPGLTSGNNVALRVQVIASPYAQLGRTMESQVRNGKVKATPFTAAKVKNITGMRFDGEIVSGKQGSMVILPLRDKTLKVWTEASQYVGDFDKIILPNLNFIP